jgi:hypothetical protein
MQLRRFAVALSGASVLVGACRGAAPASTPTTVVTGPPPSVQRQPFIRANVSGSTPVRWRVPERDGQLTDSQLVALAPRIAQLRAEPDSFVVGLRDTLWLGGAMRVLAVADDGSVLGEVRRYSYHLTGLDQDSLGVLRPMVPGTAEFLALIPERIPGAFRTRGPAIVRIIVTDSAGRRVPEQPLPRGTARLYGVVTDGSGQPIVSAIIRVMLVENGRPRPLAVVGTDAAGRYDLRDLPAGTISLLVSGGMRAPMGAVVTTQDGVAAEHSFRLGVPIRD